MISSESISLPLIEHSSAQEAFESFIDQYYTSCEEVAIPKEILLEHDIEDAPVLADLLSSRTQRAVKVLKPQKGQKLDLVQMAKKNAQSSLEKQMRDQSAEDQRALALLTRVKEEIGLTRLPKRIECFDISNIQGTDNVASMVVFVNGLAKKGDYRTFKIKSVEGTPNDFASMKEVVGRRYKRLKEENKPLPDLIIIDGGKGQLGAALEALNEIGLLGQTSGAAKLRETSEIGSTSEIGGTGETGGVNPQAFDIFGLAKKQEELYFPNREQPVLLPRNSESLHLLQRVRDEAHRFAITFHRKLRAKRSLVSGLDALTGVGAARRKILIEHFGTFKKITEASLADLENVKGIPKPLAKTIFSQLHPAPEADETKEQDDNIAEDQDAGILEQ